MGSSVALLTLLAPVLVTAALDLTELVERFPLKGAIQVTAVRAQPIAGRIVIESSNGSALAAELRSPTRDPLHRGLPGVRRRRPPLPVPLHRGVHGPSRRRAEPRGARPAGGPLGRAGRPAVIPFDPYRLGLGDGCPGDTPAGRGECAIAAGNFKEAREQFQGATEGVGAALATLRLGDLAALDDDLPEAVRMWQQVPAGSPFRRLASARLCETEPPACHPPAPPSSTPSPKSTPPCTRTSSCGGRGWTPSPGGPSRPPSPSRVSTPPAARAWRSRPSAATSSSTRSGSRRLAGPRRSPSTSPPRRGTAGRWPSTWRGRPRTAAPRAAPRCSPPISCRPSPAGSTRSELPNHLARTAELYLEGNDPVRASVVVESPLAPHAGAARHAAVGEDREGRREPAGRSGAGGPPPADLKNLEADLGAAKRTVAGSRELAPEGAQ